MQLAVVLLLTLAAIATAAAVVLMTVGGAPRAASAGPFELTQPVLVSDLILTEESP